MEVTDLLNLIGVEATDDLTIDDVKSQFSQDYISRNLISEDDTVKGLIEKGISSGIGKRLGSIETLAKSAYRETFGEALEVEKGTKAEEVLNTVFETFKTTKETLEASKGGDEELQKQFEALKAKNQELAGLHETTVNALTQKEQEFTTFKSNLELNTALSEVKNQLVFSDKASDLEKAGYWSQVNSRYETRLATEADNTTEKVVFVDKTTGKRPANSKDFLSGVEILQGLAKEHNLLKMDDKPDPKKIQSTKKEFEDNKIESPHLAAAQKHAARLA